MTNDLKKGIILLLIVVIGVPLTAMLGKKMDDISGSTCRMVVEKYKIQETASQVLGKETENLKYYRDLIQEKCR